ncbi:hypothetical protein TRFO_21318 [Tritrichomonas foetus]|uniref:Uncharacterized protein n=1 Tax=Tritrichomonas foetus TaxID=1144522 RepID=A0A1J4KFJ0_9EUKA|nr:hypothetical protein TRFO_21318 [Tritrichomonas foetus]|eukprot:OHT09696.1 hypothetical protein TRFO_21318 [Tritrichomonas foetus]
MFFLFFSLIYSYHFLDDLPDPTQTAIPTKSAYATAKSGAPSKGIIWGVAIACVATVVASVSILCIKKEQQTGFANTAQILLEKNEI